MRRSIFLILLSFLLISNGFSINLKLENTDYIQVILYGQSLGLGWECPRAITTDAINGNYMVGSNVITLYNDGTTVLNPLVATKWKSGAEQPIVSCVNRFADAYRNALDANKMFIAMTAGEGGQTIERLSKECTNSGFYTSTFIKTLDNTVTAISEKTVSCPAILYMQGEYNATVGGAAGKGMTPGTNGTTSKTVYKQLLLQLKNNMQSDIIAKYGQTEKPLFFIYQTSGKYITSKDMPIVMAQIEFAEENADVVLMNPHYALPDYTGGHLSTNGYRWYGEYMAKSLIDELVLQKKYKTLHSNKFDISGNKITISYDVPVAPLVFDTWTTAMETNYGFALYKDGVAQTISKVEIINNSQVEITCNSALIGTIEIVYAGNTTNGTGNLRDSDGALSKYTYFDDSADSKQATYLPLAQDGSSMYGKRYGLQNWSDMFYQSISVPDTSSSVFSQAALGDYVSTTSGGYDIASNWSISNGSGGYSGIASSVPTTGTNVWIPEGKFMTSTGTLALNAKDLHIMGELNIGSNIPSFNLGTTTAGGNLYISSTGKFRNSFYKVVTNLFNLYVYGTTIKIDGQFGALSAGAADDFLAYSSAPVLNTSSLTGGGAIRLFCQAVGSGGVPVTTTISGAGVCNITRLIGTNSTTGNAPQIININMDVNLMNNGSAAAEVVSLGGNNGGSDRTLNILAGRKFAYVGGVATSGLHRGSITGSTYTSGNVNYNVYGVLDMGKGSIHLTTSSNSGYQKDTKLNVMSGGTLVVGNSLDLWLGLATGQTCALVIADGATVKFGQSSSTATTFSNSTGAAIAPYPSIFTDFIVDNSFNLTYPSDLSVRGNLTLTTGNVILGNNNLTISGSIMGASSSKYIVTNGTGKLIQTASSATTTLFPVGASVTSYDPVIMNPIVESTISVKVSTTLPAVAPSDYTYNVKSWEITPTTASSTIISLTPSEAIATIRTDVIGRWSAGAYTNTNAIKLGNSYTATFDSFSPFVTGSTNMDTGTDRNISSKIYVSVVGNQATVNGTQFGQSITVYNTNGQQVKQAIATGNQCTLNLNKGLYLIKVNSSVLKVAL